MEAKKDILEDLELRSEEVQEVLYQTPNWMIRWSNLFFLITICVLIAISWILKYPEVITAPITVTSYHPPEKVEARADSRIEYIFVKDHQHVKPEDLLMVLQSAADYKDVLRLRSIINSIPQQDISSFPLQAASMLKLGEVQEAYNAFAKSLQDMRLFEKLRPYVPEDVAADLSIAQYQNRMATYRQQKVLETDKFKLTKKNFERLAALFKTGAISAQEMEAEKMKFLQAKQNLEAIDISVSQLEESVNNAKKIKRGVTISSEKDNINYKMQSLQLFEQLRKKLRDWEQSYLLVSSTHGTVGFQQFWSPKHFVKNGDLLLAIVPDRKENLMGKMFVPAANSGKISKGKKVLIKLDNYQYQEFGIVRGKVQSISLSPDKDGNYYVEVLLPSGLNTSYGKKLRFDKELKGNAEIVTDNLRLIERIFNQFRSLLRYQD
ncbi:Multidrug resistance efflux pump [Pedobacter sp. ok626]|uniref:HlyD family secretion protein n=1 Tax=Pedobacter sp. ok626 TaxID=1761882 RepID=UPI000885EDD6|nr:HlyD family secretion protein [Pedobacter sp. ok626]SDJ48216.1 Multidrug resistance efflux pump [Pedobacter sp. ok626]